MSGQSQISAQSSTESSQGPKAGFLTISVMDPVKQDQGGLNPYISYRVNTTNDFSNTKYSVIRRFRDFAWLSERLADEFPGVFSPPLPSKETLKRFDSEHIEKRRADLERFLTKISMHEELNKSDSFLNFLKADDQKMNEIKEEQRLQNKASNHNLQGEDIKRHFGWAMNTLKAQMGMESSPSEEKTASDLRFEYISSYISELDEKVQNVAKHVGYLVRKQETLGSTAFDLGFSLTQLALTEKNSPHLRQILHMAGEKVDAVSIIEKLKAQKEMEALDSPINEYVKVIASIKVALHKRQEKKLKYDFSMNEYQSRFSAFNKFKSSGGKDEKLASSALTVESAKMKMESAKKSFEEVDERISREFERFKKEKDADIRKMLKAFVMAQIECCKMEDECWQQLLPSIDDLNEKYI